MLVQERLIIRVRQVCEADERLDAAPMYGSFAAGEADAHSDVAPHSGGQAESLCGRFANWLVLAHHVASRGETLRAWDAIGHVHRHLLRMARLVERRTEHWLTPSRRAEWELPAQVLPNLRDTTASAHPDEVRQAIRMAWHHGRRYWTELAKRHDLDVPQALFAEIDATL
jgi:lincosamide nucleotidyltransferase